MLYICKISIIKCYYLIFQSVSVYFKSLQYIKKLLIFKALKLSMSQMT